MVLWLLVQGCGLKALVVEALNNCVGLNRLMLVGLAIAFGVLTGARVEIVHVLTSRIK